MQCGKMIYGIWAQTGSGGIGINGTMPWHLPKDLNQFRTLTFGQIVIMGRNTYESICKMGRILDDRVSVVISKTLPKNTPGVFVFESIEEALLCFEFDSRNIFIIGGAQLLQEGLKYCNRVYISLVQYEYTCDTFLSVNVPFSPDWINRGSVSHQPEFTTYLFERKQLCPSPSKQKLQQLRRNLRLKQKRK